jgi:hypothetical protein
MRLLNHRGASMSMDEENQGPKPEDVRAAAKGWALFGAGVVAIFGAAYIWIEMLQ